jgi:hypothetical protein
MEGERVRAPREFDDDRVAGPFMRVVLGQFHTQASRLDTDGGVALRIEASWAAQDLSGDLVLLEGDPGVIERVLSQVAKEFAQGFGTSEDMIICKLLYLLEAMLPTKRESMRQSHLTET